MPPRKRSPEPLGPDGAPRSHKRKPVTPAPAGAASSESPVYHVNKHVLARLGGAWEGVPPFAGDEDKLYRWVSEPALWARLVMGDLDARQQQRLVQLHAALHDGLDASGFVLWRALPALRPAAAITLRTNGLPDRRTELPRVALKQAKLAPSSRFGAGWEARSHEGPPPTPSSTPAWLRGAWRLVTQATFPFLGGTMPVVDAAWADDRFSRTDATTHALVESGGGGKGARVAATIIETPFPAERLLRSLVNAGKDDEILYIDAICADRYGAAYRLLTDLVAQRQAAHPDRRLVVVLMAVVSSDVVGRYKRWGFSYGGLLGGGDAEPVPFFADRVDALATELSRFEQAIARCAPSPCSVVGEVTPH